MTLAPELTVIIFGLLASASWGAGDFSGGLATRKQPAIGVLFLAHFVGLLMFIVLALLTRESFPPIADMGWGAIAGLSGAVGLGALYTALASGRMGVAAPIVGVISAAIPVMAGLMASGAPTSLQLVGFMVGIISLWLVSYSGGQVPERRVLLLAVVAGVGLGMFIVFLDRIQSDAIFWPLAASRFASFAIILIVLGVSRRNWRPNNTRQGSMIVLSGLLDGIANVCFVIANQSGRLDIAAVLSSLYPAMTILLARFFLKERLSRIQLSGIFAAVVAIALISLPSI